MKQRISLIQLIFSIAENSPIVFIKDPYNWIWVPLITASRNEAQTELGL